MQILIELSEYKENKMKFLLKQIMIVSLVCIFFAALSNLSELGTTGWILTSTSAYSLYRIYRGMHENFNKKNKRSTSGLSDRLESFMFSDVTDANNNPL